MNRPKSKSAHRNRRHRRVRAHVSGNKEHPRLVVFRSLRYTYAQLVDDTSGKILAAASDMKMKKTKKLERAKEVGKEVAEKALKVGISSCVFDRNGYKYHGRVKALAEAAREAGLQF